MPKLNKKKLNWILYYIITTLHLSIMFYPLTQDRIYLGLGLAIIFCIIWPMAIISLGIFNLLFFRMLKKKQNKLKLKIYSSKLDSHHILQ